MHAVIKTGGKQYRITTGDILEVEKLEGNAGDKIIINEILMVGDKIGSPLVKGAAVTAEIYKQKRDDKVLIFKKKRRKGYRRMNGHRQDLTVLKIIDIKAA